MNGAGQDKRHKRLSKAEWAKVVDEYELGLGSAAQLGRKFGISGQAIWVGLKKRGAIKACRVHETIAPLIAELDRRDRARILERRAAWERSEQIHIELGNMVAALEAADRDGIPLRNAWTF